MKKLLLIPLLLFCVTAFGQWTKPQLYSNINTNIRLKTYSPTRMAALLDSLVATMNTSSFTLSSGNGTTANGTAVDLGGTLVDDVAIDGNKLFQIGNITPVTRFDVAATSAIGFIVDNSSTYRTSFGHDESSLSFFVYQNPSTLLRGLTVDQSGITLTTLFGSDATGDTYYRNSSGYFTRLAAGTNGHVLTLAGGIPSWAAVTLSTLAAATGTNTINNAAYAQEWQWNSLASETGLLLSSSSTAAASNTNTVFRVNQTGANGTSTQTTYGGYFSNTKTGTSSTNIAGYFAASGGTTNNGIVVGAGNVLLNQATTQSLLKSGGAFNLGISDFNTFNIVVQNTNRISINGSSGAFTFATNTANSGSVTPYTYNDASRTGQTASTESNFVNWVPNTTQFATGAMTTLRAYKMNPPTYSFVGASTITDAYTLWVDDPVASTNATITNNWAAGFVGNINVAGSIGAGAVTTVNTGSVIHAKGSGTGTNKTILIEDSGGTDRFYVEDDGSVAVATTPTKDNAATQILTRNSSSGEIEYKDAGVTYSSSNVGNEMVSYNHGTLGSAATSSVSIHVNSYYSNSTTLFADVTVVAVKTDGSASAHAKVSGRFRKDSGGTFNLDENGTVTTSDAAIIADVDLEINGTNPSIKVTMGAASGNYKVVHSANTTWATN